MKLVYVAGCYSAETDEQVERNVNVAEFVAASLNEAGGGKFGAFCPHLSHYIHAHKPMPHSFWMAFDLEILRHCQAVVVLPGWNTSRGVPMEIAMAEELSKPVIYMRSEGVPAIMRELNRLF